MLESAIQSKIKRQLEKNGWLVVKIITCTKNGWPDLQAHKAPGKTIFIEAKRPGQKPTDLQLYRHEQLRKQGFVVIVATSVNDVKNVI